MNQDHDSSVQRFTYISRRIMYSFILIFCLLATIGIFLQVLGFSGYWLETIGAVLFVIAAVFLGISWIMPGVLIVLGVPWLAQAWLRGMNPVAVWKTSWEQSSVFQKCLIYFWSTLFSGFTLFAIISLILQLFRK